MPFTASDICKIILAIFVPPLGVFLERGCNADCALLTILGYIPGIIHALYMSAQMPSAHASADHEVIIQYLKVLVVCTIAARASISNLESHRSQPSCSFSPKKPHLPYV
ncbi:uncharacterized protein L969DRAFT_97167 [Mixia osmundae IAM 14324]|uniref:uncharacterized protein n=1 Tax=Mixia osmundae (strain CBS 9802 / IAM 14324 / JCM 22182 / KY 12970) TaxID=764103 RepID=UPI0004A54F7A|nr:uncharacterized protein L969DRAFT_97167 [Mixia osmundae IAM 14324]KEI36431.1 hypothetical protein L969DRAFT_97167 [Mixia osmundae IAM 14324]